MKTATTEIKKRAAMYTRRFMTCSPRAFTMKVTRV